MPSKKIGSSPRDLASWIDDWTVWRDDERCCCREGKLPKPGW